MSDLIKLRRDTAANWTSANPVLSAGEAGYETDTKRLKVGDGSAAWTSLGYTGGAASGFDDPATWGTNLGYDVEFDTDVSDGTLPTDWTWVNQGTSAWSQKYGQGILTPQDGSATLSEDAHRMVVRNLPSESTWSATAKMATSPLNGVPGRLRDCLVLRESSSGKYWAFGAVIDDGTEGRRWAVNNWSSPGTYGGAQPVNLLRTADVFYHRLVRAATTTYHYDVSADGITWERIVTSLDVSSFCTPNQIGFMTRRPSGSLHVASIGFFRVR